MDFRQALADLDARQPEQMPQPSLDRIRALTDVLDDPQLTYPSIHITGTNGKTTTARLVTALSCAHGLVTGTFVSPHVTSVRERLSVCGEEISEDEFADEYTHLAPFLERVDLAVGRLTYFETLTALAYLWFADKPVALGVFEVGMGGTWDATNLVRGDVAVIAPIGLDHTAQLGPSIESIATEKAGILKTGATAVVRAQRPEAMEVIRRRAEYVDGRLILERRDFALRERIPAVGGQSLVIDGVHGFYGDIFVPLFGEQAGRNAAAALAACEALLGRRLDDAAVRRAFAGATAPGRLEVVSRQPLVVLDGAHNPDAMQALAGALRESFHWNRLHLVIAMFSDKDVEAAVPFVGALTDRAYVTTNSSLRAAPPERIEAVVRDAGVAQTRRYASVAEAVAAAREDANDDDLILVTGSFYTVADARPLFVGA